MAERKTTERKYYLRRTEKTCYLWIVCTKKAILIQFENDETGTEIISFSKFHGALPFRPEGYLQPSRNIINHVLQAMNVEISEYRPLTETLN